MASGRDKPHAQCSNMSAGISKLRKNIAPADNRSVFDSENLAKVVCNDIPKKCKCTLDGRRLNKCEVTLFASNLIKSLV